MNKKIKNIVLFCVIVSVLISSFFIEAVALTDGKSTISFSSSSIVLGNTVTVTVSAQKNDSEIVQGINLVLEYNENYLQLKSVIGDVDYRDSSVNDAAGIRNIKMVKEEEGRRPSISVVFTTLKAGTTTIKAFDCGLSTMYNDYIIDGASANLSINVPNKSFDNTLKKLTIGAGTLTPAFSSNVTEYKVTVPYNVEYFNIVGIPNHSGASVSYSSGDKGPKIKVGTTVRTVTVTAENGAVKKYNVTVTRLAQDATSSATSSQTSSETSSDTSSTPESNPLDVIVNGSEMKVSEDLSTVEKPAGLELGEYEYNGVNVPAFNNKAGTIIALYLIGEGNSGLYLYKPDTDTFEPLCILSSSAQFIILSVNTITEGDFTFDTENVFSLSTVNVNGNEVPAYIYKDEKLSDFAVVCAQNSAGEMGYYTYDISEGTLQRYNAQADIVKADKDVSGGIIAINDTVVVLGCFALTVIAIIAIIIVWAVRKKREKDEAAIESTSTQDAVFDWENEVIVGDDFADTQSDEDAKLDFEAFFEEQKNELNSDQEDEKNTDEPENEE